MDASTLNDPTSNSPDKVDQQTQVYKNWRGKTLLGQTVPRLPVYEQELRKLAELKKDGIISA